MANHMTDNGLSQIDNLEFTTNYGIGNSDILDTQISGVLNEDSQFIPFISSIFANSVIDAAKTPTLIHRLNLNSFTAPKAFMLIRSFDIKEWVTLFII